MKTGEVSEDQRVAPPVDSDEHKRVYDHVMNRVHAAESLHEQLMPEWIDNYRAFLRLPTKNTPKKKKDWQSDTRQPYIFEQVQTLLPRLVEGRPRFDVIPQTPEIDRRSVRAQSKSLEHTLWRDNYAWKSAQGMLNTIIFGVGWSKQSWLYRCVERDMVNRVTGGIETRKLVTDDRGTISVGHPFDVMWDPNSVDLESCRFVVWRTITTTGQVRGKERRRVKDKNGVERWTGIYNNTAEVNGWGVDRRDFQLPNKIDVPERICKRVGNEKVELLEVFDRETDMLYVIANRRTIIRCVRLPHWHGDLPVACAVTTPDVGVLHGISEVQMLKSLQEMLWLIEHQRLDNTRLQMDLVLLIRDTVEDMDEYQIEPGAKWPVRDPSDIQPLQYPQPQMASFQDMEMLRSRIQAVAGTAYMAGGGDGAGMDQGTASGILAIIEEGNRRVDFRLNLVRSMYYERQAQQLLSLTGQYQTETVFVPDGRSGTPIPVTPDDLAADVWVRASMTNDTSNRSLRQQQMQLVMQALTTMLGTPIPTVNGQKQVDPMVGIELLADSIDRDPEELLTDMQAVAPAMQPAMPGAV